MPPKKKLKKEEDSVIEENPTEYFQEEIDKLFLSPNEKNKVESSREIEFHPLNTVESTGPLLFNIEQTPDEFTDLSKTFLTVTLKVLKSDGTPIDSTTAQEELMTENREGPVDNLPYPNVYPVNNFLNSLFKRISLDINNTPVGSQHMFHPQLSTIKTLLSCSDPHAKSSLKNTLGWVADNGKNGQKSIANARFQLIQGSVAKQFKAHLSNDVFNSRTYLPPNNSLRIRLERSTPDFCLIRKNDTQQEYMIKLESVFLTFTRVLLKNEYHRKVMGKINRMSPYYLPFNRTEVRAFDISTGSRNYKAFNIYSGILPTTVMLVFTTPECLGRGNYDSDPNNFSAEKYQISRIKFLVDENEVLSAPYAPDWKNNSFVNEYIGLYTVMKVEKEGMGISYDKFGTDYAIFAASIKGFRGKSRGNISVEVEMLDANSKPISGLLIADYDSCLKMYGDKELDQIDY